MPARLIRCAAFLAARTQLLHGLAPLYSHSLGEPLPAHRVVELLAVPRPPVDAAFAFEKPSEEYPAGMHDGLGVAVHDGALREIQIELVCSSSVPGGTPL